MRQVKVFSAAVGKKFGDTVENFGDNLMADLLRGLFSVEPVYVKAAQAELIGVGSILDAYYRRFGRRKFRLLRQRPWRKLHVWGSGFLDSATPPLWPQRLEYHAVRGELTKARIGGGDEVALGDPAILLPRIWPKKGPPTARVAIIPHFVTYRNFIEQYGSVLPPHWRIIDLLGDPKAITAEISSAEFIISSSLHGLIVADAYDIPSVWMEPTGKIKGDGYKFADYFSFRGATIPGPLGFDEILADFDSVASRCEPSAPSTQQLDQLIRAFPFK
ncbi:MAG TPA: polysaccharide pyruvyl transferase family protein [Pararhizobium sp.]|uniref:polysaccharide pyruvyl transferase family protein n=1 Tax=Pararhizobium sp. TaxID=1977563 RepID=UPI002D027536|nr:polysaccharide pyruvyl transferase family protein [Pararhizobium sp.]HTO34413.1 polysaccharide pyruvyl transferase family protein [Pararhizobium sp.]